MGVAPQTGRLVTVIWVAWTQGQITESQVLHFCFSLVRHDQDGNLMLWTITITEQLVKIGNPSPLSHQPSFRKIRETSWTGPTALETSKTLNFVARPPWLLLYGLQNQSSIRGSRRSDRPKLLSQTIKMKTRRRSCNKLVMLRDSGTFHGTGRLFRTRSRTKKQQRKLF